MNNEDYIFSLLTGYHDPPAGIEMREGLHYNPYMAGGSIAMARVLYDGLVEYEDGTPATASQMAKDVTCFLKWASEPEQDERKKMGMKAVMMLSTFAAFAYWWKRHTWSYLKSRKLKIVPTIKKPYRQVSRKFQIKISTILSRLDIK